MKKKIRVLHIGLDSHLGGIETYLMKLATYIDKERYQFDFLMFKGVTPCFYDELKALGCRFYAITSRKENFWKNRKELNLLMEKERFDIVHCHQNSLSYIAPILAAKKYGYKVIVHSRNGGSLSSISARIRHSINFYMLPKHKIECVAVSDLAGEWMFGKKSQFTVLNNGLNTETYRFSESARIAIRDEFGIGDNEVILHTGAFRIQKNHELIIDIFNLYQKRHPKSILLLVGEGELKQKIEQKCYQYQIEKKSDFCGEKR